MSRIIGGGGGGLTLDEIKTGLQYPSTPIITSTDRNGATANAVAGIHNPCKTILNEHRPVCTKEYHLTGKYLDGADNPDVWFPIVGVASDASISYSNRVLRLRAGTGAISASRCVIDQTKFSIAGNFIEVTCELGGQTTGSGGERKTAIGFMPQFSAYEASDRAIFTRSGSSWYIEWKGGEKVVSSCPLGRNIITGDILTVRLDRVEGSSNIDIVRFYVNGQKQYETTYIPTVDVYAGIGVFNLDDQVTSTMETGIKYFGVRYVP